MSSPAAPAFPGSSPKAESAGSSRRRAGRRARRPTVAVVGAADHLGTLVTERLVAEVEAGAIGKVLALDVERGTAQHVTWRVGPLDAPDVAEQLRGADVVVMLAAPTDLASALAVPAAKRRDHAVRRAQAVATACAAVGAQRLVAVTSAMVLGAAADNPVPLPDDAPIAAVPDAGTVGDLLEIERVLARVHRTHPGVAVTVLRPSALVGPGVDTIVSRHFEAPRLLVLRDGKTCWQFCHVADLADAVATAVVQQLDGALTVASESWLEQDDVERLSGMRRVELPAALAFGTAERLHRVGVLPAPASDLAFVVHPWVVSSARLREAGWAPVHDNETCLGELLEEVRGHHAVASRRLDRKDAALGAAGAAVALVGTAALVRRRRGRRS
ncbi:NAD-dependent epimerase/dehydratase family protein [Angustibacter sp. McL0619]|uniref:NAD-dependent epimerase/dehydratase family protein n=1 Tax=Angustibacter sp. McL0619 TaxID=3415676 RepID=UPI003CF90249